MQSVVLRQISYRFTEPVLQEVSAHFTPGTFSGILGANGVGKSTLVKLMGRWLPLQSGAVEIGGRPLSTIDQRSLARLVAVVPQEQVYLTELTVREMVELGRIPHQRLWGASTPEDNLAVDRAMQQTDIHHFADRIFGTLSGGERQRVRLAMALAQAAGIILLDEPTSHLDIRYQVELLALLADLAVKGYTIIAVLHDVNLAAMFCHHLVLLADGQVLKSGSPAEVVTRDHIRQAYQCEVAVFPHPTLEVPQIALMPTIPA